jgi:Holliday junction DNA helicase RuvA
MIAVLRGHLLEKHPSRLIVDVHGVGYDVQVPVSTFYQAGETGNAVTLRIHTHVREDQIALFGFATALEHDLFERLIAVNVSQPRIDAARMRLTLAGFAMGTALAARKVMPLRLV